MLNCLQLLILKPLNVFCLYFFDSPSYYFNWNTLVVTHQHPPLQIPLCLNCQGQRCSCEFLSLLRVVARRVIKLFLASTVNRPTLGWLAIEVQRKVVPVLPLWWCMAVGGIAPHILKPRHYMQVCSDCRVLATLHSDKQFPASRGPQSRSALFWRRGKILVYTGYRTSLRRSFIP